VTAPPGDVWPPVEPSDTALRRGVLAVSVLHDLDLTPLPGGDVELTAPPRALVTRDELLLALAGTDPETPTGRDRVLGWLTVRRWLADTAHAVLEESARPVGTPVDSPLHPGPDWVRRPVLGGALDLGLGFVGLRPDRPDDVVVVAPAVLAAAGVDADGWWPAAEAYLERMGELAVQRWQRDPGDAIRPMGDCDVVTLLGSRTFRAALAGASGGLCPAAVPMRTRGWLDLSRVDPAFALAAAAATEVPSRGFSRPLLLTADEVALALPGGRPTRAATSEATGPGPA